MREDEPYEIVMRHGVFGALQSALSGT